MKSGTSQCRHFVSLFIIAIWCQTGLFAGLEFAAERGVSKSQRDNRLERVVKESNRAVMISCSVVSGGQILYDSGEEWRSRR